MKTRQADLTRGHSSRLVTRLVIGFRVSAERAEISTRCCASLETMLGLAGAHQRKAKYLTDLLERPNSPLF